MKTNLYVLAALVVMAGLSSCQDYFYGYPESSNSLDPKTFQISNNIVDGTLDEPEIIFEWGNNDRVDIWNYSDVLFNVTVIPEPYDTDQSRSDVLLSYDYADGRKTFSTTLKQRYLSIPVKEILLNDSVAAPGYRYFCTLEDVVDSYPCVNGEGRFVIANGLDFDYVSDRENLIKLYESAGGDNWNSNWGWCSDEPLDNWAGVRTDGRGHVIDLYLDNNNMSGSISDVTFPYLEDIDLSYNNLDCVNINAPALKVARLNESFSRDNGALLDLNSPQLYLEFGNCPGLREIKGTYLQLRISDLSVEDIYSNDGLGINIDVEADGVILNNITGLEKLSCNSGCELYDCRACNDSSTLTVEGGNYIEMYYVNGYDMVSASAESVGIYDSNFGLYVPENVSWASMSNSYIGAVRHQGFNMNCYININNLRLGTIQEGTDQPAYVYSCYFDYTPENWIENLTYFIE